MTRSRKEIAQRLDIASKMTGEFSGSTPKQNWFLAGLLFDAGADSVEVLDRSTYLTKKQASFYIDKLLREKNAKAAA